MRRPDSGSSSPAELAGEVEWLAPGQIRIVLEVSRALATVGDRERAAATATELIALASGASSAAVAERLGGGGFGLLAQAATGERAQRGDRAQRRLTAAAREVVRTRAPVWAPACGEKADPGGPVPVGATHAHAYLPLLFRGELAGILTLSFDGERGFDRGTRSFLLELASECSSALARGRILELERDRAASAEAGRAEAEARLRWSERLVLSRTELFERERFSRARVEAKAARAARCAEDTQRLTWALADAKTSSEVVAALTRHGPAAFGAVGLALLVHADGALHVLASAASGEPNLPPAGASVPVAADCAETQVYAARVPVWCDAERRRIRESPAEASLPSRGSWLGVPIPDTGSGGGVLALAFAGERVLGPDERARLVLLAEACASVFAERVGCEAE